MAKSKKAELEDHPAPEWLSLQQNCSGRRVLYNIFEMLQIASLEAIGAALNFRNPNAAKQICSKIFGIFTTNFIIECDRRRVPRGSQVPIAGMDQCESKQHVPDRNCPICDMLASDLFGFRFT